MPGTAYHFQVLQETISALQAASDPRGDIMNAHSEFAHLGAMGPDILKYTFIDDPELLSTLEDIITGEADTNTLSNDDALALQRNLLMLAYSRIYQVFQNLWPYLEQVHTTLDELDVIAEAEDQDALADMQDALNELQSGSDSMDGIGNQAEAIYEQFLQIIPLFRPNIQTESTDPFLQTTSFTWRLWEFLRWRGSGKMARALIEVANEEPDDTIREQKLAYAYGYLCHIAASVTSEPFINNIVGGPCRTHWWRNRFVANYVDVWTHGFKSSATAPMAGDEPSPAYEEWQNLCNENLQDRIAMGGTLTGDGAIEAVLNGETPPDALPGWLAQMLEEAVSRAYEGIAQPMPADSFSAATFNNAYVGAFSALWFMSNGRPPLCIEPLGDPPGGCTDPPDWVSSGGTPADASPDEFVDSGKTATAAILAILALLFALAGMLGAGLAALAGAAAAAGSGFVDWAKLRCHLYWTRYFLFTQENAIRESLVLSTIAYPMTRELGAVTPDGTVPATDHSGQPFCRSRANHGYPLGMDAYNPLEGDMPPDTDYVNFPDWGLEMPMTADWPAHGQYPDVPLDDPAWIPTSGDMTDNTSANFPAKTDAGQPVYFGNAVVNAVAVIQSEAAGLVDYNLDGDRGYGWMAWRHQTGTYPSNPPIDDPEPA